MNCLKCPIADECCVPKDTAESNEFRVKAVRADTCVMVRLVEKK